MTFKSERDAAAHKFWLECRPTNGGKAHILKEQDVYTIVHLAFEDGWDQALRSEVVRGLVTALKHYEVVGERSPGADYLTARKALAAYNEAVGGRDE